jgi:hypothetical protein
LTEGILDFSNVKNVGGFGFFGFWFHAVSVVSAHHERTCVQGINNGSETQEGENLMTE